MKASIEVDGKAIFLLCSRVAVIEVSCGEYGDNVSKLVAAIDNGKNDIRDGRPLPNSENLPAKVLNGLANATNDIAKEARGRCLKNTLSRFSMGFASAECVA